MSPAPVAATISNSAFELMFRRKAGELWSSIGELSAKYGSMTPAVVQVVTKLSGGAAAYSLTLAATTDIRDRFEQQVRTFTAPGDGRLYTLLSSRGGDPELKLEISDQPVPVPAVPKPVSATPWNGDFSAATQEEPIQKWLSNMRALGVLPEFSHFVYRAPYTQQSGAKCDSGAVFVMLGGDLASRDDTRRAADRKELETKLGERSAQCLISILFECWQGLFPPSPHVDPFFRQVISGNYTTLKHSGRLLIIGERGSGKTWLAEQVRATLESEHAQKNEPLFDCSDAAAAKEAELLLGNRTDLAKHKNVVLECVGQLSRQAQESLRKAIYDRVTGKGLPVPLFICTDAPVLPFRCVRGAFDAALLQLLEYNSVYLPPFRQWPLERIALWTQSTSPRWGWDCASRWTALTELQQKEHLAAAARGGADDLWGFQAYLTRILKEADIGGLAHGTNRP